MKSAKYLLLDTVTNFTSNQPPMRTLTRLVQLSIGILFAGATYAQDVPLGALPMQYNSSFAGEAHSPRVSSGVSYAYMNTSNYRDRFGSAFIAYDQFIPAVRSGIGITYGWDTHSIRPAPDFSQPTYQFSSNTISLAVAPKFSIGGKYTLSPSLDYSYNIRSLVDDGMTSLSGQYRSMGSRAALLFNSRRWYVGYTVGLFGWTDYPGETRTRFLSDRLFSFLQAGYTFQKNAESNFSFTPQLVVFIGGYTAQEMLDTFYGVYAINLNFRYRQLIWGVNNTGYHLGWQTERLRLMLSSNLGLAGNDRVTGANLTVRYIFSGTDNGW
jgi:hypothetical protein